MFQYWEKKKMFKTFCAIGYTHQDIHPRNDTPLIGGF